MGKIFNSATSRLFYFLVLIGFLSLDLSSPVWADTINVPGDKPTIQEAIDAAVDGDVITVDAGTYTENITLGKRLKLQGARANEDACEARSSMESIIDSTGVQLNFISGSAGSIIDGFTFSGSTGLSALISSSGPTNNLQIVNNIIEKFSQRGISLNSPGTDITLSQNRVDGTEVTGTSPSVFLNESQFNGFHFTNNCLLNNPGGHAILFWGNRNVAPSLVRNPLFHGNLIDNNTGGSGVNLGSSSIDNAEISGNIISNNTNNGIIGGPKNSQITGNTFDSNGIRGLQLLAFGNGTDPLKGAQNNIISANCFLNNGSAAIEFSSSQFPGTISTNTFTGNNIIGNSSGAVYTGPETIDATGNFWGDISGPSIDGPGIGDSVDGTSGGGSIDFSSFLSVLASGTPCSLNAGSTEDHFQCYDLKRRSRLHPRPRVSLNDQFGFRDDIRVGKWAEFYCTPVDKNGEGINNLDNTMACYEIEETKRGTERRKNQEILIENQFGKQSFELEDPEILCVPSTQLSVSETDRD